MYQYIDRPVQSLDFSSRFLVWSMRQWVSANCNKRCPCSVIGPAFMKWNMTKALPDFFMAMGHLNEGAKEPFMFGQMTCGSVHEIEALILSMQREYLEDRPQNCLKTAESLIYQKCVTGFLIAFHCYCDHVQGSQLCLGSLPSTTAKQG